MTILLQALPEPRLMGVCKNAAYAINNVTSDAALTKNA